MKDKRSLKKYIFIAVIALTVIFIWSNSLKTADASMNDSNGIKAFVLALFSRFGINLEGSFFIEFIRKFGHFAEYFLLGTLLFIYKIIYMKNNLNSIVNITFCALATALIDETIQLIPSLGRSGEIRDLWIDLFGVLIAFLAAFLINVMKNLLKKPTVNN